ncbi:MAG TPA: hypothetical protein VEC14_14770 [Reyranellaceae bacterium]|nr:hypothetical protein [Reyranellaceae bacterium]
MVRGAVGTIAILAAFVVIEQSVDASTGDLGACKAVQAYAQMQPGEGLTVRAEPSPEASVIGNLSVLGDERKPMATVVTMTASQSGWVRIALQSAKDFKAVDTSGRQYGWVPADQLTVDARTSGAITVYSRPGLMGKAMAKIENEDLRFRVLGCRGDWLQVINASHGNIWIDKWCANPDDGCRKS